MAKFEELCFVRNKRELHWLNKKYAKLRREWQTAGWEGPFRMSYDDEAAARNGGEPTAVRFQPVTCSGELQAVAPNPYRVLLKLLSKFLRKFRPKGARLCVFGPPLLGDALLVTRVTAGGWKSVAKKRAGSPSQASTEWHVLPERESDS